MKVYTLDNGARVIDEASFDKLLNMLGISPAQAGQLLQLKRSGMDSPAAVAAIIGDNPA